MPPRTNKKAAAGRERQKEQEAKKKAEEDRRKQEIEDKEWQKGSNIKGQTRAEEAAAKADETARKKREKEELLRQEEADNLKGKVKKVPTTTVVKSKKQPKKDNLSLLEDALVKNADLKVRAQKRLERETKLAQEIKTKEKQEQQQQQVPLDPLLANTETMLQVEAGRSINKQSMEMMASSGIDAALESMGLSSSSSTMTYKDYEEIMLPIVKQDFPGLRLTQYKEKVYQMWKKSPDNPSNQIPS